MGRGFVVAVLLLVSFGATAQEHAPRPRVSNAALTSERIAIYRAVLAIYLKGSDRVLNLANTTEPIGEADTECLRGLAAGVAVGSTPVIHRIGPSLVADTKIVLVDPDLQQKTIKENDPQNLIRKAMDARQEVADEQLDQSVESALKSGLFTLSEIVFDKKHRHAALSYSFVCGRLCGQGNTLVLNNVGHNWLLARRCGGWVS